MSWGINYNNNYSALSAEDRFVINNGVIKVKLI